MEKLDVPQGTLDLMILTILGPRTDARLWDLAEAGRPQSRHLPGQSRDRCFPSLYRLEQDGKLKAEWRPSENNRNAKYYRLTPSGRRQLEQHRQRWDRDCLRHHQRTGGCMTLLHRLASVLGWLFRRQRAEQALDDELQAFIEHVCGRQDARRPVRRAGAPAGDSRARRHRTDQGTRPHASARRVARRSRTGRALCLPHVRQESRLHRRHRG